MLGESGDLRDRIASHYSRAVFFGMIGSTAAACGIVALIVPDVELPFTRYLSILAPLFYIFDAVLYPEHVGVKVFTNFYWYGKRSSWFQRVVHTVCLLILISMALIKIYWHHTSEIRRNWLQHNGASAVATLTNTCVKNKVYSITYQFRAQDNSPVSVAVKIPPRRFYKLDLGQKIQVVYPFARPNEAIPAEFEIEAWDGSFPIEIAWFILLMGFVPLGWYIMKPFFSEIIRRGIVLLITHWNRSS